MKTMTFEETKQVELEILTNVAQFCENTICDIFWHTEP